jgi:hypothetical protein
VDGKALVRLAQLRGRIAALARGGRFDIAAGLLHELARADLALGMPADALLRARQTAQLADERGEPVAGPLVVLAATLLAADAHDEVLTACTAAIDHARPDERPKIEAMAKLVAGAAQRRAGRLAEARVLLDASRGAAARLGEASLAGLALAELAWIDLAEDRPAAAATCFEFAAEFLRRAWIVVGAIEADVLAVSAWAMAGDVDAATDSGPRVADAARGAGRLDLVAHLDGVLADLALARAPEAASQACALAAESARALPDSALARDLVAQARLRQVRASEDAIDRARHLEAGLDLALALPGDRAAALLGSTLAALVEHGGRAGEIDAVASAIARVGDQELSELARSFARAGIGTGTGTGTG